MASGSSQKRCLKPLGQAADLTASQELYNYVVYMIVDNILRPTAMLATE